MTLPILSASGDRRHIFLKMCKFEVTSFDLAAIFT